MQKIKKVNSYFFDVKVENAFSKISGKLRLIMRNGKLQLQADEAVYSFEDEYTVFSKGFKQVKIENHPTKNVLILGFGLGSAALILEKKYKKNASYLGIEIDEIIANWNKKYLPEAVKNKCNIEIADAYDFIFNLDEKQKFDLIIVDIFVGHTTPEKFKTEKFLEKTKLHLTKKGIVLYNTLAHKTEFKQQSKQFFKTTFSQVFNKPILHKVLQNNLLQGGLVFILLVKPVLFVCKNLGLY